MPYQLRISLDRTRVWRGVIVPESLTLGSLHLVIQQAMGWEDRHLFMLRIGQKRYGPDDLDEESITLKQVFKGSTKSIGYVYDFGDWWEHTVTFEQAVPKMAETLVVGGEDECPEEASGGGSTTAASPNLLSTQIGLRRGRRGGSCGNGCGNFPLDPSRPA